jgi:hypothetical protein
MKRKSEPKPEPTKRQPRMLSRAEERALTELNAHFDDVLMKHHPYADADDFSTWTEEP